MLVRESSWLRILFRVRHSGLRRLGPRLSVFVALAVLVTWAFETGRLGAYLTPVPFTLLALPLGVFLGFRGNRAHDRYWEARTQWGNLVNASRSFARQVIHLIAAEGEGAAEVAAVQRRLVLRVVAYCDALRTHLADDPVLASVEPSLSAEDRRALEGERNIPIAVLRMLTPELRAAVEKGWLHPMHLPDIETAVTRMTDVQGACERIKNTPLPIPVTGLTHRFVALYCLALPFGLVESMGWATPAIAFLISYAFLGLEAVAEDIEHPFERGPNQLPMLTLCRTIEMSLRQALGDTENLPTIPTPRDGVLP